MCREAALYKKTDDRGVECELCAHHCVFGDGASGRCRVRQNRGGRLYSLNYGKLIAGHIDPIEKKPLFHFYPGSQAYSIAAAGCNFTCAFCQNWQISQKKEAERLGLREEKVGPEAIVESAVSSGCKSIACTYTEPTVYFEYACDCAAAAHQADLANVWVTNGFMSARAFEYLRPFLDAANIDIKSFRDEFYRKECGGRLQPVLDTVRRMKEAAVWVEVTTLIIPGKNDSPEELADIAAFIASLSPDIPWHISRFFPQYKREEILPTPAAALERAYELGKKAGLRYIYPGNIAAGERGNTSCAHCGELLIQRAGFFVEENTIINGKCPRCGSPVAGRFDA